MEINDLKQYLKQPTIMLVDEDDTVFMKECMNKGIAMLVIPKNATEEDKLKLMDGYKGCKLMSIEIVNLENINII